MPLTRKITDVNGWRHAAVVRSLRSGILSVGHVIHLDDTRLTMVIVIDHVLAKCVQKALFLLPSARQQDR